MYECVAENSRGGNVARGQLVFHGKIRHYLCLSLYVETFIVSESLSNLGFSVQLLFFFFLDTADGSKDFFKNMMKNF